MESDELNTPLGQNKRKSLPKLPASAPQIVAGVLGLSGAVVLAWAVFANDPLGGEPTAVVSTGSLAKQAPPPAGNAQGPSRYDGPAASKAPAAEVKIPATLTAPRGSKTRLQRQAPGCRHSR